MQALDVLGRGVRAVNCLILDSTRTRKGCSTPPGQAIKNKPFTSNY